MIRFVSCGNLLGFRRTLPNSKYITHELEIIRRCQNYHFIKKLQFAPHFRKTKNENKFKIRHSHAIHQMVFGSFSNHLAKKYKANLSSSIPTKQKSKLHFSNAFNLNLNSHTKKCIFFCSSYFSQIKKQIELCHRGV